MSNNKLIYKKDYFGFVYEWTDSKSGMKYIGSHYGDCADGYKGSNVRFQRAIKSRPENFFRIILDIVKEDDKKLLLECEQKWLDSVKNIKDNILYYNKKNEACGGWSFITQEHINKRAANYSKRFEDGDLTPKMKTMQKLRQKTRKTRWKNSGFSDLEKRQHSKYGYKIKIIMPSGDIQFFDSCDSATRILGVNTLYGMKVCKTKDTFKGFKITHISDPEIDCRTKHVR